MKPLGKFSKHEIHVSICVDKDIGAEQQDERGLKDSRGAFRVPKSRFSIPTEVQSSQGRNFAKARTPR